LQQAQAELRIIPMALQQFQKAPAKGYAGHATRAGHTSQQPFHYDFSETGYGFPQPPKFDDKYEERAYFRPSCCCFSNIWPERL
jgi:hypothetical protein